MVGEHPVPARFEFSFEDTTVRVLEINGTPWWVLVDVCVVLGIANPRDAAGRLDDDEKGVGITDTLGGPQEVTVINESGLYSLTLTSRKPSAKRFKKWITSEVLPAIRKTGGYGTSQVDLNDPAQLRALLLNYSAEVETTKKALAAAQVEASAATSALDRIAGTEGLLCLTDAAKVLGQQPKAFIRWLTAGRYIYRRVGSSRLLAYQDAIQSGLIEHKLRTFKKADGTEGSSDQPMVTTKGIARFARLLGVTADWSAVSKETLTHA
ncbi:phage antirepressor [Azospirillum picis]|uniref:Prophage antirepressor-like protein n=1 Tax=Azospirillum picis TaxID=488438 RepID=A0ABU0MRW6_9PROT|nr:phage antirepressor KilAC domain-containing protein [Azospirillum picis]MBP2302546.1 prophage antirepressor-like protein [Azospirillum picis]MDQ0536212.1 prophage antirepressor-like protein [Azospirillum picis]